MESLKCYGRVAVQCFKTKGVASATAEICMYLCICFMQPAATLATKEGSPWATREA